MKLKNKTMHSDETVMFIVNFLTDNGWAKPTLLKLRHYRIPYFFRDSWRGRITSFSVGVIIVIKLGKRGGPIEYVKEGLTFDPTTPIEHLVEALGHEMDPSLHSSERAALKSQYKALKKWRKTYGREVRAIPR